MTDPSALSQVAGFVTFALAIVALAWGIDRAFNRAPIHEPEPSRLDTLDGVGKPPCHSTGPRGGHAFRSTSDGLSWKCRACGDVVPRAPHRHRFTGSLADQVFTCVECGAYPEDAP